MSAGTAENPYAGQGSVLLDIGGEIGALVVSMPAEMEGVEVEIRPVAAGTQLVHGHRHDHDDGHDHGHEHTEAHAHHPHVAVVNRPVSGGLIPSLVFPDIVEGRYGLYLKGSDDRVLTVRVVGGEVAVTEWPADDRVMAAEGGPRLTRSPGLPGTAKNPHRRTGGGQQRAAPVM